MKNLISIVAIVLLILWAVGYFGFGEAVGQFIHILLILAIIALLYRLITGSKS
ncbi:lmo0937 family membrane protein [Empedobacter brevis]|uniref:lmo0937 family membrane protein n=1 Tax=Empedobacter brevis TaxID=247 RepID=UPI0023F2D8C4|nr:lmo0937 family membrane protein [Empedobacter brevis]